MIRHQEMEEFIFHRLLMVVFIPHQVMELQLLMEKYPLMVVH